MATIGGIVSVWRCSSDASSLHSCKFSSTFFKVPSGLCTRRTSLLLRCVSEDASEGKPKQRRRKKADSPPQEASVPAEASVPLNSGEAPPEVKKKKKAVTKSRKKKEEEEAKEAKEEEAKEEEVFEPEAEVVKAAKKPKKKKTVAKRVLNKRKDLLEEESLYDQEERWKIMDEEKLQVIEGKMLEKLVSDQEDEDEEEDDEEDDDDEEDEEKPSDPSHTIDMKFPEKECYALISSYKPRKIDKNQKPPLTDAELWWNYKNRDPDEHVWSEFQRRPGLPDITKAAMSALTGQIKLFGDTPSVTETHIYRARKFVFYEERLAAEERRRKEIGPMAYYQEWVKAWDKDTSKEAVQKHYEETGEDVALQLMNMLACQTRAEFRHMMGTDIRIRRDPLEMRATREMKRSVFGGDPVYPTINYIKKPGEVVDYRGPNFHQPRPTVVEHLIRCGTMKTRAEHNQIMALQQERLEAEAAMTAEDDEEPAEEMAAAIDIGEKDLEDDDEDDQEDVPFKGEEVINLPTEKLLQLEDDAEPDPEVNI